MIDRGKNSSIIIAVLCSIVLIALYYFYLYLPAQSQVKELKIKKEKSDTELVALQELYNKAKNSKDKMEELKLEQLEFLRKLPPEVREENVIVILSQLVKMPSGIQPIELQSVSFKDVAISEYLSEDKSKNKSNADKLISMDIQITGKGKYSSLKQLLTNIVNHKPKVVAKDINIASGGQNVNDPDISFSLQIECLGFNGSINKEYFEGDKEINPNLYEYKSNGTKHKTNIFEPFSGMAPTSSLMVNVDSTSINTGSSSTEIKDDFYVKISPATYDLPGVTIGKSGDGTKALNEPKDGVLKVEFTFDYKNGAYFYKYKTESKSYPSNYTAVEKFTPADNSRIGFLIRGNDIMKSNDSVAAEVSIVNNTNLPVNVIIKDIEQNSNRLRLIKLKGLIKEAWI